MPHILMELFPPFQQDRIVSNLLCERVLEDVFDIQDRRLFVNELAELQVGDEAIEFFVRSSGNGPSKADIEFASKHREHLQEGLLIGAQPVDACGEDSLHGWRNA